MPCRFIGFIGFEFDRTFEPCARPQNLQSLWFCPHSWRRIHSGTPVWTLHRPRFEECMKIECHFYCHFYIFLYAISRSIKMPFEFHLDHFGSRIFNLRTTGKKLHAESNVLLAASLLRASARFDKAVLASADLLVGDRVALAAAKHGGASVRMRLNMAKVSAF